MTNGGEETACLVTGNRREWHFEFEAAWKLAHCLQATHGIKHFLLEPPQKVIVTPTALENFNLYEGGLTNRIPTQSRHRSGSFATVQRVQLAPTPLLMIRAALEESPKMWDKFDMFYKTQVEDKSLFVNTLKSDIESALDSLEAAPLLGLDFQILIDTTGNACHLDLDRAFISGACDAGFKE
jgi:hypothetical protein